MFLRQSLSMYKLLLGLLTIAPICESRNTIIEMCNGTSSPVRLSQKNKVIIQSPGYPERNSEKRQCELHLEANDELSQIAIKCTSFLLMDLRKRKKNMQENKKNVCTNYLQINNKKFCGTKGPDLVISGNKVVVRFESGRYKRGFGFSCYAKMISSTANITCECGEERHENRIIDGVESIRRYPWMAAIVKFPASITLFPARYIPICGGSLINDRWLISAAHCFSLKDRIFPGLVTVLLNEHRIGIDDGETSHSVKQIIAHPKYNARTKGYDIGLLELSEPIDFSTSHIRPVCLPPIGKNYNGAIATVMGWGKTAWDESVSDILLEVTIPTISNEQCSLIYPDEDIIHTMICAGSPVRGTGICKGDSGGPMVTLEDGHFVQIGVASFGRAKKSDHDGCSAAAGYTRITAVLNWILVNTKGANKCLP